MRSVDIWWLYTDNIPSSTTHALNHDNRVVSITNLDISLSALPLHYLDARLLCIIIAMLVFFLMKTWLSSLNGAFENLHGFSSNISVWEIYYKLQI